MRYNHLKKLSGILSLLTITSCLFISCQSEEIQTVEQWGVFELSLTGPSDGNPYMDNSLDAEFTNGSHTVTVPGFYDGNGTYRRVIVNMQLKFGSPRINQDAGQWRSQSICLHKKISRFIESRLSIPFKPFRKKK